jgi:hypothetical protein
MAGAVDGFVGGDHARPRARPAPRSSCRWSPAGRDPASPCWRAGGRGPRSARPLGLADAAHEEVRVEGGRGGQRQDLARGAIHHHRPALSPSAAPRRSSAAPRRWSAARPIPTARGSRSSSRISRPAAFTSTAWCRRGRAGRLHPGLDIVAADLEIGDLQNRVGVAGLFDVVVGDRADIAHHMGEIRAERDRRGSGPTSGFTPGRAGALTATEDSSAQLRRSATVTGTKGGRRGSPRGRAPAATRSRFTIRPAPRAPRRHRRHPRAPS